MRKKELQKIAKCFVNFQYGLSIVMALLLLAMIGYEVVMRYVFKSSLMGVEEVMVFPIIWLYMLDWSQCFLEKSHIECEF
ncbi:MAG: TRAP transporter small permease [Dorea sp.]